MNTLPMTFVFQFAGVSESPRMKPMSQSNVTLFTQSSSSVRPFGFRVWLCAQSEWWHVAWF